MLALSIQGPNKPIFNPFDQVFVVYWPTSINRMSNIANLDKFGKFISLRNPKSNAQTVIRFYNYFIVFFLQLQYESKLIFLNSFLTDPFADAAKGDESGVQDGLVHIRIQQRSGRKTLTTIQGLSSEYDLKKIVRACKKVIQTRKHFHLNIIYG